MTIGLVGRKCGMTRVFTEDGRSIPVTVIQALPNRVTRIKNADSDGYSALQVTAGTVKPQRISRPVAGQYAAVGAAGNASLPEVVTALETSSERLNDGEKDKIDGAVSGFRDRMGNVRRFVDAYRQYCWSVESLDGLKLAPFQLLATEDKVHIDQNHVWHMQTLANICQEDPDLLLATNFKTIDVTDLAGQTDGIEWWTSLTARGGEGMVVKPSEWIMRGKKGLVQPAVKCRGREYLRIIYGADYTADEHLPRLRSRSLGRKRSLALREFALGIEALERFVRKEPLRRVHECVFGVLALESEPVDPRL